METSPPLTESPAPVHPPSALVSPRAALHPPSSGRAFLALTLFCLHRQARARQMVWIALALLAFTTVVVAIVSAAGGWGTGHFRYVVPTTRSWAAGARPGGANWQRIEYSARVIRLDDAAREMQTWPTLGVWPAPAAAIGSAYAASFRAIVDRSGFTVFSNWLIFPVFVSFLMPLWSLSFATDSLGGERESGTLVWLLSRPLPRPTIYLAKFLALLPWAIGLNVGGFGLLCLAAGPAGRLAFACYWPAVLGGSVAFAALFQLMSAWFHRPSVVALMYSFFLETVLGNMPGTMKRASITFYTRCLMFEPLAALGVAPPEKPSVYQPVSATTAWWVLAGVTAGLLVLGMAVFNRTQYDLN